MFWVIGLVYTPQLCTKYLSHACGGWKGWQDGELVHPPAGAGRGSQCEQLFTLLTLVRLHNSLARLGLVVWN